jgi:hypothetical protein
MICHHTLSVFNLYAGFAFMNFTMPFGICLLFTEISTIFICLRWFLYTHGYGHTTCAAINTAVVFFAFLIFRLGFQVFACFGYGFPMIIRQFNTQDMTMWESILLAEMFLAVLGSIALNATWMLLIIKQVYRMMARQGFADEELRAKEKQDAEDEENQRLLEHPEIKNN